MGSWSYKALESDNGLDVVDFLVGHYSQDNELNLADIINDMSGELLGNDINDVDFLYDNTAIALAELYADFLANGKLVYEELHHIKSFIVDKPSVSYLLKHLEQILSEIPTNTGQREIIELWQNSKHWNDWQAHLIKLKKNLAAYLNK